MNINDIESTLSKMENSLKAAIKRIGPERAAQLTGLKKQNLSSYGNGRSNISYNKIIELSKVLLPEYEFNVEMPMKAKPAEITFLGNLHSIIEGKIRETERPETRRYTPARYRATARVDALLEILTIINCEL